MTMKEEYTAIDMSTAAADGFRDGQRAAQSAPAGEREAFEAWAASVGYHTERDMFQSEKYQSTLTFELWRVWQARAAWQCTQSAGVPEGWRLVMAIELAEEKHGSLRAAARALGIDAGYLSRLKKGEKVNPSEEVLAALGLERMTMYRASQQCTQSSWVPDGWQLVPKEPTAEMIEALAASFWPADWEAGKRLQRLRGTKVVFPKTEIEMAVGKYERMIAAAPAQPAAQDQGEVQRLREALESIANCREGYLSGAACTRIARAALAASTGQEVKP